MNALDWLFVGLALGCAVAHGFFAVRYREHFVFSRETFDQSYWNMILAFKKRHPRPAAVLICAVWLQVAAIIGLAASPFLS